jgi:endonuclease YncB( thermonuclease family)
MGCYNTKINKLKNCTYDNTEMFSLNGKQFYARVVDVYDGDTITVVIYLFKIPYRFNVRLAEIDTCELKSQNPEIKKKGYLAREHLIRLITNSNIKIEQSMKRAELKTFLNNSFFPIIINCGEFDKYGRLLGHIYLTDTVIKEPKYSINHKMLNDKFAYNYNGDTKLTDDDILKIVI